MEEKIYVIEDGNELIIIERINYGGIDYMLLKNSKNSDIKIAYEYNSNLYYIEKDNEDYRIIAALLLDKIKESLEEI